MDIATASAINLSKHMAIMGVVQYASPDPPTYYCTSHTLLQVLGGGVSGQPGNKLRPCYSWCTHSHVLVYINNCCILKTLVHRLYNNNITDVS